MVFSVTALAAGALLCPFTFLALEFIFLSPKKTKGRCPWWVTACGAETGSWRRPLSAANNRNNARNGRGGHERRVVAVKSGIRKRRRRECAGAALCAEYRGPKLCLKVHGQDFDRTTDITAAASVANENFAERVN